MSHSNEDKFDERLSLVLSERDAALVEEHLQRPAKPADALIEAADRYAEAVRTGELISRPDNE